MNNAIESIRVYDNGEGRLDFERGDSRDWYVWDVHSQMRVATFGTRRELLAARERIASLPARSYGMPHVQDAYDAARGMY